MLHRRKLIALAAPALITARESLANALAMKGLAAAAKDYGASMGDATRQAEIQANFARIIAEAEGEGAYAVRQAQAEMERLVAASTSNGNLAAVAAKAREAEAKALGDAVAQAQILNREASQGIAMSLALLQGPEAAAALAQEQERQRLIRAVGPNQPKAVELGMNAFNAKQATDAAAAMQQMGTEAQKAAALAQVELRYLGASNSEREEAVALEQLRLQYVEAIFKAGGNEAVIAQLTQTKELSEASIRALGGVKAQLENTQRVQDAMKQAADAIGSAFEAAVLKGEKLTDVLKSLEQALLQIFAKQFIFQPLSNLFSAGAGSLFGGGGGSGIVGWLGGLFGGGGDQWANVPGVSGWYAKGGLPEAAGLGAYRNSFVNKPTVFPFAKGGVGLMGEAGTEAIFPVYRTRSGDLGVKVGNDNGGGSSGGGGDMVVNVYNQAGAEVRTEQRMTGSGREIDLYIEQVVGRALGTPGSAPARTLRTNYGANQQVVQR